MWRSRGRGAGAPEASSRTQSRHDLLQVKFLPDIATHNNEQTFFFDDQGLLQRLDYLAVGPASHYCFDHTTSGGSSSQRFAG
jgi:hypothetical protein